MQHEVVPFDNGTYSVRPIGASEAMHSHIGAWVEANVLYVDQSGLRSPVGPIVLYDVGLGIAANALATIEGWGDSNHRLHIVSFEQHLSGLELALTQLEQFDWLARHEDSVRALLRDGRVSGRNWDWELRAGDFLDQVLNPLPPADLVFYDFYSPRSAPELWGPNAFAALFDRCAPGARLYTYSSARRAREAMVAAGFEVGLGRATSAKSQTTVARKPAQL